MAKQLFPYWPGLKPSEPETEVDEFWAIDVDFEPFHKPPMALNISHSRSDSGASGNPTEPVPDVIGVSVVLGSSGMLSEMLVVSRVDWDAVTAKRAHKTVNSKCMVIILSLIFWSFFLGFW